MQPYVYEAVVLAITDGDTLRLALDLGFDLTLGITARLRGVDARELRSRDPEVRRQAVADRDYVLSVCPPGARVRVRTFQPDKYGGRWLAQVELADGNDLASLLLATGHALPYDGGRRGILEESWENAGEEP